MLTEVKLDQSLILGEFVQWDTSLNQFVRCTAESNMMGVVTEPPYLVNNEYVGVICLGGICQALAGADMPTQGGALGVDANGRAIIANDHSCGIVSPQIFNAPARVAGDLVTVWLR